MARKRLNPAIKRSRTRSGCLTCRDRHMKCDEQQPVCRNCIKSKRKCYRGIRLNFTQYTIYNPEDNLPSGIIESTESSSREFKLLDQSITIASLYQNGKQPYEPYLHLHDAEDLLESDYQFQQDVCSSFPSKTDVSTTYQTSYNEFEEPTTTIMGSSSISINSKADSTSNFDHNTIPENFDITNLLLNNSYYINQNSSNTFNSSDPSQSISSLPVAGVEVGGRQLIHPQQADKHLQNIEEHQSRQPEPPPSQNQQSPLIHRDSISIPISHSQSDFSDLLNMPHPLPTNFPLNVSVHDYINLIEKEKYYWFLDLFNELGIWKSVIPSYCLRELETGTRPNKQLLLNCLLNCSVYTDIDIIQLLEQQKQEWYYLRGVQTIDSENMKLYENLLISITLILLGIYLKLNQEECNQFTKAVLNNQIKIFNKMLEKLKRILRNNKYYSIILINSVHSVIILRYMIIKKFAFEIELDTAMGLAQASSSISPTVAQPAPSIQFSDPYSNHPSYEVLIKREGNDDLAEEGEESDQGIADIDEEDPLSNSEKEDINEDITYPDPNETEQPFQGDPNFLGSINTQNHLAEFLKLSSFEITNLNHSFEKFDIPQKPTGTSDQQSSRSDASKLREYLWYLIKLNYILRHPNCKSIQIDYNFIFRDDNSILPKLGQYSHSESGPGQQQPATITHRIVLPNERGIAINLLREYINKLINVDSGQQVHLSNLKIRNILQLIDESMVDESVKIGWRSGFEWTLSNISDEEYDYDGKRKDKNKEVVPY